ncbi:WXG100 family type VII secretion target [Actinoplanes sp. NPDC051346]|uniref:WXG100 family type VII secretion target n=1 Tax=Actinoplanes sp. NPDC051346 TaxID=3155048 RepID=UPI003426FCEE
MTHYNVTPEYVATAATQCDNTANNVLTQLTALQQFVTGLGASWFGVTSAQFAEMMNNFHVYSILLHDALVNIGQGLSGNFVNYVNSEADNLQNLLAIDGNLIGTPTDPSAMPTDPTPIQPARL